MRFQIGVVSGVFFTENDEFGHILADKWLKMRVFAIFDVSLPDIKVSIFEGIYFRVYLVTCVKK